MRFDSPAAADRQGGVFTRRQARSEGWSAYQVRRRLQTGVWSVLLGRGLLAHGRPVTPMSFGWACRRSVPGSIVSHQTAGAIFGFPTCGEAATGAVAVGQVITSSHDVPMGIRSHRVSLRRDEVMRVDGLPTTTRARTALDCLASSSPDEALRLWAWLSTRDVLDVGTLSAAVRARTSPHGTPTLLELLRVVSRGAASKAEAVLHELLRRAEITGWMANTPVVDDSGRIVAVADILFEAARLVLEVDGYAAHAGQEAFIRDRRRQNEIVGARYRVLRVTWQDLIDRPDTVISQVRRALDQA